MSTTRIIAEALSMPSGLVDASTPILIFPVGQPPTNDGRKWKFEREDLQRVVDAFAERTEPLPILYRHGEDKAKGGEAAGWIDALELKDDGLYGRCRWTAEAKEAIRAGKWGYRSPGFDAISDIDEYIHPVALAEVSLVNDPAIGGLPPVQAERKTAATEVTMATKPSGALETLAMVRDALGLDTNATVDQIAKEFQKCISGASEPEMPNEEMAKQPLNQDVASVPAPSAQATEADRIKLELADAERRSAVVAMIRKATEEGKITAATRDHAIQLASTNLAAFQAFIEAIPVGTPGSGQVITASAEDRKTGNKQGTLKEIAHTLQTNYQRARIEKLAQGGN